jgi:predicted DNA-binding antitoxin AbrB/MazE fold protein
MDTLLNAVYRNGILNTYDFCDENWNTDEEGFRECKTFADGLVEEKLVNYNDAQKTELKITNYGRYWVVHGGFLIYLKEGEKKIKSGRNRDKHNEELKEELKEARLKFTHYRIVTYWWSFALTLISFLLSLLNLYLILNRNK